MDTMEPVDRIDRTQDRAVHRLSQMLWRERELLEELDYAREVSRLTSAAGSPFAPRAAADVDRLGADLRSTDLMRAVAADAVAAELDLAPDPPLSELAESANAPWGAILAEHGAALRVLVGVGGPSGLTTFLR